jgi:hypothetical protein
LGWPERSASRAPFTETKWLKRPSTASEERQAVRRRTTPLELAGDLWAIRRGNERAARGCAPIGPTEGSLLGGPDLMLGVGLRRLQW